MSCRMMTTINRREAGERDEQCDEKNFLNILFD